MLAGLAKIRSKNTFLLYHSNGAFIFSTLEFSLVLRNLLRNNAVWNAQLLRVRGFCANCEHFIRIDMSKTCSEDTCLFRCSHNLIALFLRSIVLLKAACYCEVFMASLDRKYMRNFISTDYFLCGGLFE